MVVLQTVTFEETSDGRTKVTDHGVFRSVEDRDSMVKVGMSDGALPQFDRLAKLL